METINLAVRAAKRGLGGSGLPVDRCPNVILERIALGCTEGEVEMFVCLVEYGSRSSLRPPPPEVTARTIVEKVPNTTLDAHLRDHCINQIHFIKIDAKLMRRELRGTSCMVRAAP
jgi:hypothetical protein